MLVRIYERTKKDLISLILEKKLLAMIIIIPIILSTLTILSTQNLTIFFADWLALVICLSAIVLSASIVHLNKSSSAYFRNFVTATNDTILIIGDYIAAVILIIIEAVILISILSLLTIPLDYNIIPVLFLIVSIFISIGMTIGYLFRSEENSVLTSLVAAILLFTFSDLILNINPIIERINPFALSLSMLKDSSFTYVNGLILLIYFILFLTLTFLAREYSSFRDI